MRQVTEKEFVHLMNKRRGKLDVGLDLSSDPPMVTYKAKRTGEVVGRYPEYSLSDQKYSYKDMFYEVKD